MTNYLLAIETSCDDTSVAIVDTDYHVYANILSSQPDHNAFGGVLPELASRLHLKNLPICLQATLTQARLSLDDISAVVVSINPGLIGSLLVGLSFAKALAWTKNIPLITVNHMLGHVLANQIDHPELHPPWLALIVSGGHTELVLFHATDGLNAVQMDFTILGQTLDDAAGEAFDKIAQILGLGFPGGPVIDQLATIGDPTFYRFPRALDKKDNFDFSFSGLKTSVINWWKKQTPEYLRANTENIAASVQQAIVDILVKKTINATKKYHMDTIILAGGVSANSALRKHMQTHCDKHGFRLFYPPLKYCMDNAAMIGIVGIHKYIRGEFSPLSVRAFSTKGIRNV